MKNKTNILIAGLLVSLFSVASSSAQSLSSNEIFSAIDGEGDYQIGESQRVNFDLAGGDSSATLNRVLAGIDGETDYSHKIRINYAMDVTDNRHSPSLDNVLSGIDGETNY